MQPLSVHSDEHLQAIADCTNAAGSSGMPSGSKDERRADRRYPLVAEIEYRTRASRQETKKGRGKTINISRSTVFFQPLEPVPAGTYVELFIPWPAQLDGSIPLTLVVSGIALHSRDECIALRIIRYEFHTRRQNSAQSLFRMPARCVSMG